jgi:hypothetical protein
MHVLGDLLTLSEDTELLALPWWHRAALGLMHETTVYVSLVQGTKRALGELVISVIDPNRRRISIECQREDKPGVLSSALSVINAHATRVNVALAEAVTIESGDQHQVTLVCELPPKSSINILGQFQRKLTAAGFTIKHAQEYHPETELVWCQKARISHGLVHGVSWQDLISNHYSDIKVNIDEFDLGRAVVTADPDDRVLRYVFPRRGALTVRVRHADEPGTLELITDALGRQNLNILSGLLRRGGNVSGDATVLAVCEPLSRRDSTELKNAVRAELKLIDRTYRIYSTFPEPRPANSTIYARHPDEIAARVPESLLPMVLAARRKLPRGKVPIFLSRRFLPIDNTHATHVVEHLRLALEAQNCHSVEALPAPGDHAPAPYQVESKLWASSGAVVLIVDAGADAALSMNISHEYGFMQGQGKPILVLVENGQQAALRQLSNLHGLNVGVFAKGEIAFAGQHVPGSIQNEVANWINRFGSNLNAIAAR